MAIENPTTFHVYPHGEDVEIDDFKRQLGMWLSVYDLKAAVTGTVNDYAIAAVTVENRKLAFAAVVIEAYLKLGIVYKGIVEREVIEDPTLQADLAKAREQFAALQIPPSAT